VETPPGQTPRRMTRSAITTSPQPSPNAPLSVVASAKAELSPPDSCSAPALTPGAVPGGTPTLQSEIKIQESKIPCAFPPNPYTYSMNSGVSDPGRSERLPQRFTHPGQHPRQRHRSAAPGPAFPVHPHKKLPGRKWRSKKQDRQVSIPSMVLYRNSQVGLDNPRLPEALARVTCARPRAQSLYYFHC